MRIEKRKVSELKEWEHNPRTIDEKSFNELKEQIKELKPYKPLLITEDGTVLGGNMRLKAFRDLDIDEIECSIVDAPTNELKIKYALSDNDQKGKTELDLLVNLIDTYPEISWDNYSISTDSKSLNEILDQYKEVVEDEVPEVSDEPAISKLGEVYQLGRHRLMCGDSTKIEDVEKLMDGKKADMVFTDPPYNYAQITGAGIFAKAVKKLGKDIEHISKFEPEEFLDTLPSYFQDGVMNAFIFCNKDLVHKYLNFAVNCGYSYNILTWHKKSFIPLSGSHHFPDTEYIIYLRINNIFNSGLSTEHYRKYFILNNEKSEDHPTIKPQEIIVTEIEVASNKDGIVADMFGGSGSTLIACEQTNRICYGMELDPKYCDVIRKRYAKFIGKENEWQEITPAIDKTG